MSYSLNAKFNFSDIVYIRRRFIDNIIAYFRDSQIRVIACSSIQAKNNQVSLNVSETQSRVLLVSLTHTKIPDKGDSQWDYFGSEFEVRSPW